jgi:branched-chain amino acid transport system ATP-binding protein
LLELLGISACYGKLQALDDVSLAIEKGQLVSIVGPNGAGKSTLAKVIVGLVRPVRGSVLLDRAEITQVPTHEIVRRGVVLVPEGRQLFPEMTVRENLVVASSTPETRPSREKSLEKVMEIFPVLRGRERQLARTLSGGEQQMLAIGRGMMSSPKLLISDEPSLGLAPIAVKQIFEIVGQLKERGTTVVLIEQNIRVSLKICDYGYVLESGRIVLQGAGHELLQDQKTRQAYLGD